MGSGGARPPWPPGDSVAAPSAFRRGALRGILGPPPLCPGQCALRFGPLPPFAASYLISCGILFSGFPRFPFIYCLYPAFPCR